MRAPTDRPNIVLINCDDLGYGDLGCYGSQRNDTPAIDRLAREGLRLTDFYQGSPVCSPSRGGMMTGCYPGRIGFDSFEGRWVLYPGQGIGLNASEVTVATLLRQQGYATKHVGKWHCGDQPEFLPTRHGFDNYYGIPFSNDMGRYRRPNGDPSGMPPLPLVRDEEVIQAQFDQAALIERYVEESVRFVREHQADPFFLYLGHMHVHLPHYVKERFLRDSRNGRYGAAVAAIDWSVAVLTRELQRLGLSENTLMIFTSDNGSRMGDQGGSNLPLRGTKGTNWEGGVRVPCICRWPGQIPAGTVHSGIAAGADLLPTFCGLGGANVPDDRQLDGVDVGNMLRDPTSESPRHEVPYYILDRLEGVRVDDWKLRLLWERRDEQWVLTGSHLYDLRHDIGETHDLAARHPAIVSRLEARLDYWRDQLGDAAQGATGSHRRPIGRVADPRPLTEFDPEEPYFMAEYDLGECG